MSGDFKVDSSVHADLRLNGVPSGVLSVGSNGDPSGGSGSALLRKLERFGEKPGLARIDYLLAALGRPQDAFPAIHVAGTNGKGSTCAMIAAVLQAAGLRVGMFTSPHLIRYNERIVVDGVPIDDERLAALLQRIEPHVTAAAETPAVGQPTEFEVATAAALAHFADEGVDVAVIEVGLGGRFDSTNVVDSVVSVITPVGIDHTRVLGTTLAEIAADKAGIVRPGVPVIVAPQHPDAAVVIKQRAFECDAPLYDAGVEFEGRLTDVSLVGTAFDVRWQTEWSTNLHVPLVGAHQADNAAVAVAAVRVFAESFLSDGRADRVTRQANGQLGTLAVAETAETASTANIACEVALEAAIRTGLRYVRWPGRFETIGADPLTIVDGAHNAESARALATTLSGVADGRRTVLVIGMLAEKPVDKILQALLPCADVVVFTKPSQGRTEPADPATLAQLAGDLLETMDTTSHAGTKTERGAAVPARPVRAAVTRSVPVVEVKAAPAAAVARARHIAEPDGVVVICGSLYLVGEVKSLPAGEWQTCRE